MFAKWVIEASYLCAGADEGDDEEGMNKGPLDVGIGVYAFAVVGRTGSAFATLLSVTTVGGGRFARCRDMAGAVG